MSPLNIQNIYLFIYLLVKLGLCCCRQDFSSYGEWGLLSSCESHRLLIIVASLVAERAEHGCVGLSTLVHRPSCPAACGIFPDQGLNLSLQHWQVFS